MQRFCTICTRSRRSSIMIIMIILFTSQIFQSSLDSHFFDAWLQYHFICLTWCYYCLVLSFCTVIEMFFSCLNKYVVQCSRLNCIFLEFNAMVFAKFSCFLHILCSLVSARFQRRPCTSASMPCSRHPRYAKFIYGYVMVFCHPVAFWTVFQIRINGFRIQHFWMYTDEDPDLRVVEGKKIYWVKKFDTFSKS